MTAVGPPKFKGDRRVSLAQVDVVERDRARPATLGRYSSRAPRCRAGPLGTDAPRTDHPSRSRSPICSRSRPAASRGHLLIDVRRWTDQRVVRDVGLEGRLRGRHPQQLALFQGHGLVDEPREGRVVALGVPDHQDDIGRLRAASIISAPFGHREAHRLLGEDVLARASGFNGDRRVRTRGKDEDGIEVLAQHRCASR